MNKTTILQFFAVAIMPAHLLQKSLLFQKFKSAFMLVLMVLSMGFSISLRAQNNSLYFDNDAYISGLSGISPAQFTVEFWILLDVNQQTYQGIYWSADGQYEPGIYIEDYAVSLYGSASANNQYYTWSNATYTGDIVPGVWSHIAFTYDGSYVRTYVDGNLTNTIAKLGANVILPTSNLIMGYNNSGVYGDYNLASTAVDEFRIWNYVRSGTEIQSFKDKEIDPSTPGLVRYYNFNDGVGGANNSGITTLTEKTGNGTSGTLVNFTLSGPTSNWVNNSPSLVVIPSNTAPSASAVSFSGSLEVGSILIASYTYHDNDNDAESGSSYKWYRSNDNAGTNKTAIVGATLATYTLQSADEGKYISFEVTPKDGTTAGTAVESAVQGPVLNSVLLSTNPTLTFTSTSGLEDFIAEDGEAHSQPISDIDIQIYNISDVNGTFEGTLSWRNNLFLGSVDLAYSALTNPANEGSKGMLIKSKDGSEFKLTQFGYYNWGETQALTNTVKGYRNGVEVASTTFQGYNSSYDPSTISLGSGFTNVDEVRFYISAGGYVGDQSGSEHSINYIQLGAPIVNTPPIVNSNLGLTVTENYTAAINSGILHADDVETSSDAQLTFTITNPVSYGMLFLDANGNNRFDVGETQLLTDSTFTQDDINNQYVHYTSTTDTNTADSFGFTLSDPDGGVLTGQTFNITITPVNDAPVASALSFSGFLREDSLLTATYTYADAEGDAESGTSIQWYRSDDNTGTNRTLISGASSLSYMLQSADVNKYISVMVTPHDGTTAGTAVESSLQGMVVATLSASATVQANASCFGHSNGMATVNPTGGVGPYYYSWAPSGGTSRTATGLAAGTYTVTVTDSYLNITTANVTITQPSPIMAVAVVNNNVTVHGGNNGAATVNVIGGTPPYTYEWSNLATTASISGVAAGTYDVTITDANACTKIASVTITQPAPVVVNVSGNETCENTAATLTASGADDYEWYDTPVAATPIASGKEYTTPVLTANTTYYLEGSVFGSQNTVETTFATDNNHRGNMFDVTFTSDQVITGFDISPMGSCPIEVYYKAGTYSGFENNPGAWTLLGSTSVTYTGSPVTISVGNLNIPAGQTYGIYVTSATTAVPLNYSNGANTYTDGTLTVSTGVGLEYPFTQGTGAVFNPRTFNGRIHYKPLIPTGIRDTVDVTVNPAPSITYIVTNVSCNGGSDGTINLTVSGGTGPYSFAWNNGSIAEDRIGLSAGTYHVTVTDVKGCTSSDSVKITEPAVLMASAIVDSNETCAGAGNGGLSSFATGGTAPYTYSWSNGATTASIQGVTSGTTYTVTITDAKGCTDSVSQSIIVVDTISPTVVTQNINAYLDATGNTTITAADVDNGTTDACGIDTIALSQYDFDCDHIGVNNIYFGAADVNGNFAPAAVIVTVIDTIKPVVLTQNATIYLNGAGEASIVDADIEDGSTDACGVAGTSLSKYNFDCSNTGANTVYLSVTDVNGNVDSASAIVTVLDTISPVAKVQSITAYLDASGVAVVDPADVDNGSSDICGFTLSLSQTTFDCTETGLNLKTFTITDASGNKDSKDAWITIKDTISPELHLYKSLTVSLDQFGNATIAPSQLDSASRDNCSNLLLFTASKTTFNCSNLGPNAISVTAYDSKNNSVTGIATVTVKDYQAPVVLTQNIIAYLDATGNVSVLPTDVNNGTTDNCSVDSLWLDKSSFGCVNIGQNIVKLYAKDQSGNSAQANAVITVLDTVSPMVSTQNITVYLNASGSVSINASDVDNGSSDVCTLQGLSLSKSTFTCADLGANTVTLTATDASANSKTAAATVTVMDTISPTAVTQNITVSLNATGTATITAADVNNGSSDACGIQLSTLDMATFNCSDLGANTVTLTVLDNNGNSKSATATVTVVDNTAPIVATQNITIYLDANGDASITPADIDNNSSDNCGISNFSLDINVFDCADLGQNLVMLTATDASNNSSTKSAFVTVLDTIDPTIDNLPATITAYAPANQCAVNVQWPNITGSDNCGVRLANVSKANGSLFSLGTTTVNVNVADASGNTVSQSFNVVVVDTVSPTVSNVPINYTVVPNTNSCDAIVNWVEPVAIDNCGGVTWTKSHLPGSVFQAGTTTVTYTATDSDLNSTTVSFVVTVTDQLAPTISNVPANITVSSDAGSCDAVVNFTAPTVNDNCTGATFSSSHTSGSVFPIGTTTVVFTAVDGANNTTTASFTITVEDNQKPVVSSMPANDTVGVCGSTYTYAMPVATDNCSATSIIQTSGLPSGSIFPAGVTVNTFRISDANGNDTVVSFAVVVIPQGMPNLPNVLEVCANMPAVELTLGQNIVWFGNGIVGGSLFNPAVAGVGRHQLSYTYTDNMGCNVSGSMYITVSPVPVKPVINRVGSTALSTDNYNSYQWYRNGVAIPGATGKTYSYTIGGNYQVMVTNSSGCENHSDGIVIGTNGGSIGIKENLLSQLEMYPNPANDLLTFDLKGAEKKELELVIFNVAGKKVFEVKDQTSAEGKLTIDLGHLPDATYIVRIKAGDESAVKRVVIY